MEAMEVDLGGPSQDPGPAAGEPGAPIVVLESGSSTEEEGEGGAPNVVLESGSSTEEEGGGPSHPNPRLLTWRFSHSAEGGQRTGPPATTTSARTTTSASQPRPRRRVRPRQPLRVHYPSQTVGGASRFLDFLLRVPAANRPDPDFLVRAEPDSGTTTEVSDSEDEPEPPGLPPAAPPSPGPPLSPSLNPPAQDPAPAGANAAPEMGHPEDSESAPVPAAPAAAPAPAPLPASQGGEEGEGETCPICFEPWTTAGEHRLAALRCGHLFGHTCIERWVKGQGQAAKCPQCNKKAKRSDIILLFARRLRALDNTEQEGLKKSLEQQQSRRRTAELESAQFRLQLQVVTEENGKLRKQLQELRTLMAQTGSRPSLASLQGSSPGPDGARGGHKYVFSKAVLVSQTGGCRVMSYCEPLSCLLASQPSPHTTLVPGFGVKKISTVDMKASQYVPIHIKQIRGLAFNRTADSLLLSAALDNTVKLTSLMTNTVVQTYNAGRPVWSCCWCLDDSHYVYAGLNNGSVLVYDTRDTSTFVQELKPLRNRCPVASLSYVPRAAHSAFPCGGVIAGSLEGGCFWEQVDSATYRPHQLPLVAGSCTDIQVDAETRHCLVTYRPVGSNPSLRCVLMELNRGPQQGAAPQGAAPEPGVVCSCQPVQQFNVGPSCKLLTKNAVFRSPAGGGATLVCAGDESSTSTLVWDAGTGALIQKLSADLPVLDICPFEVNQESYLASLTEKMMKIYKWE